MPGASIVQEYVKILEEKIPDRASCENCRFYAEAPGECRRYPPVRNILENPQDGLGSMVSSGWPETKAHDWCGEHRFRL